jgi:SAM-dependent methyltransferase
MLTVTRSGLSEGAMARTTYIHGTDSAEQARLAKLGSMTDASFIRFLELGGSRSILEVGSGLGNLTRQVAVLAPNAEVWGIEQSPDQLAQSRADLPNLRFRQADAHALPFEDNHFDVAFCRFVLEHVADPVQVLREMRRVLRVGGKAFVQENNILVSVMDPPCPQFEEIWQRFARLQKMLGGDGLIGKKLLRLMQAAGFRDVHLSIDPEVHYSGSSHFRTWIENLIGNVRSAERKLQDHGLTTAAEIQRAVAELERFMERDDASAFFYWNRAKATKP